MDFQEVSLSWDGHHRTLVSVFESLLEGSRLVDCTISAEGRQVKAHKEVLSAFSPYFELIFREENEENPTIILGGIAFEELRALIDFMYFGNVKISEDKVEDLIDAAESLQIKGLGGGRKQDDLENVNECWNSLPEQSFSFSISGKQKRKHVDIDASEENPSVRCVERNSADMSLSSDIDFRKSPLHSNTPETLLSQHQSLSSGDMEILRPESVVKVELGADDAYNTENEYAEDQKNDEVLCKRSRGSYKSESEESVLGLSGEVSMSGESDSYEGLPPNSDLPTSPMNLPSNKTFPLPSYKNNPSSKQVSETVQSSSETINAASQPELRLKSEPKTEEDDDIASEGHFAALVKEEPLDEPLTFSGSGRTGEEMETERRVDNVNIYSGAGAGSSAAAYRRWMPPNTLLPPSGLTMEARGPGGGRAVVWPPQAVAASTQEGTVAGCSYGRGRGRGASVGLGGTPRPPRRYSCPECHKVFNQSCNLKVHLRIHTGEKPYKCTECDFAATHISNLKQHMRTHSGERPYKCTDCDYAATDISSFKRHRRMHDGERPYKCTECDYAATDVGSFKRHLRIHSGERPYKCTECEYAATGSGDLKKHQRIHWRERPEKEVKFDSAVTGTSSLINSIPKYFENFNIYR